MSFLFTISGGQVHMGEDMVIVTKSAKQFWSNQIFFYNILSSRKITFTFTFQKNTVFNFASLVFQGRSVINSLKN